MTAHRSPLEDILARDLRSPLYLTSDEAGGRWTELFPELASAIPPPYPIFAADEEEILAYGYPVAVTDGSTRFWRRLATLASVQTARQMQALLGSRDVGEALKALRAELLRQLTLQMENALLSDYGRGLFEILVLTLSLRVAGAVTNVPRLVARETAALARQHGEKIRFHVARSYASLFDEAGEEASRRLHSLAETGGPHRSSLLAVMTTDLLPLAMEGPPDDPAALATYIGIRYGIDGKDAIGRGESALLRLAELLEAKPELAGAFVAAAGTLDVSGRRAFLEPRLWTVARAMQLLDRIDVSVRLAELYTDLGKRLKRFEVIAAIRRHIAEISRRGDTLTVVSRRPAFAISPSTRPMDFSRPGVIDSAVQRFGLVYDLTSFTETLEEIRKHGHQAEEEALRFMYVFQQRLNDIRRRRRLTFEKFLGDGAFYSSRRASRVLAAACEIQKLYDALREDGFPFSKGIRIAVNFGTYQLLPMMVDETGRASRFEFFGHGIVELLRLTTGKSTREIEEIAEHLIHAGYNQKLVDDFLAPLLEARAGAPEGEPRTFTVRIDRNGELINEGIVLTPAFVEELAREMPACRPGVREALGLRWAVLSVPGEGSAAMAVGLRFVGVARLKGLRPLEIIEALPWEGPVPEPAGRPEGGSLLDLLRQLATPEAEEPSGRLTDVPPDLVAVTYADENGRRRWFFGRYRDRDDMLLDAIEVPLKSPDLPKSGAIEVWLFHNRFELTRLYEGLRREGLATAVPMRSFRNREGYVAAFLAAPHRTPE